MSMKNKIKVGILIDTFNSPHWIYDIINKINLSDYAEIVLYVKNKNVVETKLNLIDRLKRIFDNRKYILYFLFKKIDKLLYKNNSNLYRTFNLKSIIQQDVLEVSTIQTKYSDRFYESDIKKIKCYDVDVFIRFGFKILRGEVLTKVSKYGIWSFHHADYKINRGGPAGFWEYLNQDGYTGITLQRLSEELDNGFIIDQSFSLTNINGYSKNLNNYYPKSSLIIQRNLHQLYTQGSSYFHKFKSNKYNSLPGFYSYPLYKKPKNTFLIKKLLKNLSKKFKNAFYFNQWSLMYKFNKNSDSYSKSFYNFSRIKPPNDRFWADPFVVFKNNKYFIFFEELIFKNDFAVISYIELQPNGEFSQPKVILKKDYHLSYPFIFEEKNEMYMIPETMGNNSIELYKCVNFPEKWSLQKVLINNIQAVDSTILKYDDKFWIFTNVKANEFVSVNEDLYLFYSNSLNDDWIPHPQNPIISDIRFSRPAGKIFKENGKIYRPSQNGSNIYGYGIQINEIIVLNESEYKEVNVESIKPLWSNNLIGTHTINHDNNLTVIDANFKILKK